MPFIRTNTHDHAEGHLACDWPGCAATSSTFRMRLGSLPEDWDVIATPRPMQRSVIEYFCSGHRLAS